MMLTHVMHRPVAAFRNGSSWILFQSYAIYQDVIHGSVYNNKTSLKSDRKDMNMYWSNQKLTKPFTES